jgi:myo-inositol 2-dehydrogenase / D-chiro-inositol 1-dehydrogenase
LHYRACIEAGKHVFAEKPVATDVPGVQAVFATNELARRKNLAVVSGLCWRYETGMQEVIQRLHGGAIGRLVTLESTRYGGGVGKLEKRQPGWTDLEYQLRNWYYFTWLSGDFIVEQFVHELDKMAWLAGAYPTSCVCSGGRQARTGGEYGHIYDHFNAIYEFESGLKYYAGTRHQPGCANTWSDLALGSEGVCNLMRFTITGKNPWRGPKARTNMHQLEHDAMYAALRRGEIIHNGDYMARSTLMGILARQAAYTGKELTWEQILGSQEQLVPAKFDWDMKLPDPPVAVPGVTPFV